MIIRNQDAFHGVVLVFRPQSMETAGNRKVERSCRSWLEAPSCKTLSCVGECTDVAAFKEIPRIDALSCLNQLRANGIPDQTCG
jgi:hypothetical protein